MRAREPDESGFAGGVYWERFGEGDPALMFVPPWAIVHSRVWKGQVPYFAQHGRVVVFDPLSAEIEWSYDVERGIFADRGVDLVIPDSPDEADDVVRDADVVIVNALRGMKAETLRTMLVSGAWDTLVVGGEEVDIDIFYRPDPQEPSEPKVLLSRI